MKRVEGTLMLKASTSSWQNCNPLLLQSNSSLSNFFASPVATLRALLQRVWLHLQPPTGQPPRPQAEETPPPGPRDLGGPSEGRLLPPSTAARRKPGGLIPLSWGSGQRRWHLFRRAGRGGWDRRAHTMWGNQQNTCLLL